MTTVIILMYGAGAILVISAISTDPNTQESPSIVATLMEIWNGKPAGETKSHTGPEPLKSTSPPEGQTSATGTATARTHAATYWLKQHGY